MPKRAFLTFIAALWLSAFVGIEIAQACACCANDGQRYVEVMQLDSERRADVTSVRFAKEAKLYVGEAGPEIIQGIVKPSETYALDMQWEDGRAVFALRDEADHEGTLTLTIPDKITIFEVDPRDGNTSPGGGPLLYKEWKLTGAVTGAGVFNTGTARGQLLTLILQGRGNSCTSASDFSHWTLVMQGEKGNYTLFGALKEP
jgi:hypothetical protein